MTSATNTAQRSQSPATAFADVLDAVVSSAASGLERKTRQWTDKLNGIAGGSGGDAVKDLADTGLRHAAEGGGAQQAAGAEGLRAGLQGRNPAWAAVKGAWSA